MQDQKATFGSQLAVLGGVLLGMGSQPIFAGIPIPPPMLILLLLIVLAGLVVTIYAIWEARKKVTMTLISGPFGILLGYILSHFLVGS